MAQRYPGLSREKRMTPKIRFYLSLVAMLLLGAWLTCALIDAFLS